MKPLLHAENSVRKWGGWWSTTSPFAVLVHGLTAVWLEIFGDHAQVTLSRSGIEVTEFKEHD